MTVSGYYGCGNAGDEAVLAGIKRAFQAVAGDSVRLQPLSQNPAATRALHGLDARYRMDLKVVAAALAESSLLLSGGGSLLQDTTSVRSLVYYLWVVRMALGRGVPVMFYAQGMGPFRSPASRFMVRLIANRVSYITVRDEPSAQLLKSIGVTVPRIEVTADPAFALAPAGPEEVAACRSGVDAAPGRPTVGVALRQWGSEPAAQVELCARLLAALEERTGADLLLIPMQQPGDVAFADAVVRRSGRSYPVIRDACSPEAVLGVIGGLDAIVAMRLHALIFAARMAVPPFALCYDPKVESLMAALGLADSAAPWTGFSPDNVAARVRALLDDRQGRSEALRRRAAGLESLAIRNAEIALSLMRRVPRRR